MENQIKEEAKCLVEELKNHQGKTHRMGIREDMSAQRQRVTHSKVETHTRYIPPHKHTKTYKHNKQCGEDEICTKLERVGKIPGQGKKYDVYCVQNRLKSFPDYGNLFCSGISIFELILLAKKE